MAALSLGACAEAGSSEPPPQALSEVDASRSPAPSEFAAVAPAYQQPLRFVALGDGYTAGASTAAPNRDSWPAQLQQVMGHSDTRLRLISNLARPGRHQ